MVYLFCFCLSIIYGYLLAGGFFVFGVRGDGDGDGDGRGDCLFSLFCFAAELFELPWLFCVLPCVLFCVLLCVLPEFPALPLLVALLAPCLVAGVRPAGWVEEVEFSIFWLAAVSCAGESDVQMPMTCAPDESVLKQVLKFLVTGTRGL